jgi:peptidoglycan/LPS O-acetylase OafA/YrhL
VLFGVCVAVVAGALVARIAMRLADVPPAWLYASTIARADGLAAGALVALALRSDTGRERLVKLLRPVSVVSLVGLAFIVVKTHGLSRLNWIVQTFGYSLLAILFAVVVAVIALPSPPSWVRWLSLPALRTLGRYSYATYVFHSPLKVVATYLVGDRFAAWSQRSAVAADVAFVVLVSTASVLLAVISYVLLEKPALSLKDRWAPRA